MRFLSMIRSEANTGQMPSEQLMADMGRLIEEMTKSGVLLDTAGLGQGGTRVRLRNGKLSTVDGPYAEAKEVIGGFALLEAKSMEEAIEHTRRFLAIHGDEWTLECEVRQVMEPGVDCSRAA